MQPLTAIRTIALASMLAFSTVALPAVHIHAEANTGSGDPDSPPSNATCTAPVYGQYFCGTEDGREWVCYTNPPGCYLIVDPPAPSHTGSKPIVVHPVIGGAFEPTIGSSPAQTPQPPLQAVFSGR